MERRSEVGWRPGSRLSYLIATWLDVNRHTFELLPGLPTPLALTPPTGVRASLHCTMKLSGFHVSVHSGGERLKEYTIEVSPDGKKATCWMPSQSGKVTRI